MLIVVVDQSMVASADTNATASTYPKYGFVCISRASQFAPTHTSFDSES
jgi:hypothetical protein